MVMLLMTLGDA